MAVVTFITDFGTEDEYAGVMKGAVLTVNPQVTLVDISHHIPPFDVFAAARMLEASFAFFPEKTVHVTVVDPGVGSDRAIVAFDMAGHRFLAPDNGIPARLIRRRTVDAMVRLAMPDCLSPTFHGRDVFAPAAARLAGGCALSELGPSFDPADLVALPETPGRLTPEGRLHGRIVAVDHFGNLITDLDRGGLVSAWGAFSGEKLTASVGCGQVRGLFNHYDQGPAKGPLMVVGSRGCLEIAVNRGSARDLFQAGVGDEIVVWMDGTGARLNDKE
ncbi:SAM-dependent chlorinase/fluorinase [Desulfatiferula olefinivorans]